MDAEEAPHRPEFFIAGIEVDGRWIGDTDVTVEEIMHYCENEVETTEEWDLCMRICSCVEQYQLWWERVNKQTGK